MAAKPSDEVKQPSDEVKEPSGEVTQLLVDWRTGNDQALDELLPLVYKELRRLASRYLRRERKGHTLQPTALVHEAFVRLIGNTPIELKDRTHFFAVAAQAMRRVLVDHARRQQADKRIGAHERISLEDAPQLAVDADTDILAIHDALNRLAEINKRQADLVVLRFFGGLTNDEAAVELDVSTATVERDWKIARVWLHRRITRG